MRERFFVCDLNEMNIGSDKKFSAVEFPEQALTN